MNRYVLFAGDNYYAAKYGADYQGTFQSIDACKEYLELMYSPPVDWYAILFISDSGELTAVETGTVRITTDYEYDAETDEIKEVTNTVLRKH